MPTGPASLPPAPSIMTGQPVYQQRDVQALLNRLRGGGLQQVGNQQQQLARNMAGRGFATSSPGLAGLQQGARQQGERDIAGRSVEGLTRMSQEEAQHRLGTEQARVDAWARQMAQNAGRQGLDVSRYQTLSQASLDALSNAARLASGLGRSRAETAGQDEDNALLNILLGYGPGMESHSYQQKGFPINYGPSGWGIIAHPKSR